MKKKKNLKNLSEFIDDNFGKTGTNKRESFEKGYSDFKMGVLIQEARLQRGLTQEQVAKKCGTSKGYISKIENNIKDVRLSTLQKIIETGLDGRLQFSIKL